jgi:hypothetical protein
MHALALISTTFIAGVPVLDLGVAVSPLPVIGFVLQMAALGTAIGSVVALHAKRRDPLADTWSITTAWASLGFVAGAITAVLTALV